VALSRSRTIIYGTYSYDNPLLYSELRPVVVDASTLDRRARAKAQRRQQLIDATINCIARKGLGSTTLGDVAREAGLSQGIVNLHFESKDNLLAATLRYLAEDYDEQFMKTLRQSPDDPAEKLIQLIAMDLKPTVCDRKKLAVWFAFWGEVKAVPTYQKICAARDEKYHRIILELTEAINADGKYAFDKPAIIANALSAMTEGFWLSCLINPKFFDRSEALMAARSYLEATFPDHY
jgi:TetR/AcrR family transcriptional repressor of bet genes